MSCYSAAAAKDPVYSLNLSDGRPSNPAYGDRLTNWLDGAGYGSNATLKNIFRSNASDDVKYMFALAFYDGISGRGGGSNKGAAENNHNDHMYLESHDTPNGSYLLDRRKGHIVATLYKTKDGLKFSGDNRYITFFGGRNEWGGIADRMADGVYHNKG